MRGYLGTITLAKNSRGIWDLDVSKGCTSGLRDNPAGCYGDCYAARTAKAYGIDFSKTVLRNFKSRNHERQIIRKINTVDLSFIRIGCAGDPSESWEHTLSILRKIARCNKEIVIITKHWTLLTNAQLVELGTYNLCVNTSVSALDSKEQRRKSVEQYHRLKSYCKSFLRVVSCDFNIENEAGHQMAKIQSELFKNENVIDTVFRPSKNNPLVKEGVIKIKRGKFMNSLTWLSKFNRKTFVGKCSACKEQCGVFSNVIRRKPVFEQQKLSFTLKPKPKIKRNTGEKHSSFRWDHGDQIFLTKKEKEERDKEVKK